MAVDFYSVTCSVSLSVIKSYLHTKLKSKTAYILKTYTNFKYLEIFVEISKAITNSKFYSS